MTTLPAAAQKVLRADGRRECRRRRSLREAIQSDPVLVARILRRLNSSYYALSQKISDLKTAISLLGMREIRNLALTVFVSRFYEGGASTATTSARISGRTRWASPLRRGWWLAFAAAARAKRPISPACCTIIGLILLDQTLRRHFHKVLDALDRIDADAHRRDRGS